MIESPTTTLQNKSSPNLENSRISLLENPTIDMAVNGLSKTFGTQEKNQVLDNITFVVPKGQSLALIGHNGSGKSTLLRCCLRLIEPSRGQVDLLGTNITLLRNKELQKIRSRVGFIFQGHNLVRRLSVLTNVIHGAQSRKKGISVWYHSFASKSDREEAMYCLERVGLAHLAGRRVDRLSGGESQRVAIARALMQRPRVMMADEPVASLDPSAGQEVMELFLRLIRDEGITLIFVSHNLEHALYYSDRILGLRSGKLELDFPSDEESVTSLRGLYD